MKTWAKVRLLLLVFVANGTFRVACCEGMTPAEADKAQKGSVRLVDPWLPQAAVITV